MTEERKHHSVSIQDEDYLYRILAPDHIGPDGEIQSNAFRGGRGDLSIFLAKMVSAESCVELLNKPGKRLGQMQAKHPRSIQIEPIHDGVGHPAHGYLSGTENCGRKLAKQIAKGCKLIHGLESKGGD